MTVVYDETNREWALGARIGGGGEGDIYRLRGTANHCAKIYSKLPIAPAQEEKLLALRALSSSLQSVAAIPLSVLYGAPGKRGAIGMVLPYVEGLDAHEVYHPEGRLRHLPNADLRFLISAARNIAFVFQQLHEAGIIVGDVSEQNIRIMSDATVRLIDCDSVQLSSGGQLFPCGVGSVMWTPSELQGKNLSGVVRTENHDRFGLAQLIFLLLFCGRYPFAGTPEGNMSLEPGQAIAKQAFAYDPEPPVRFLSPPNNALPFGSYPSWIRSLFIRAFSPGAERTDARPTPLEWIEALEKLIKNLEPCCRVSSHIYWSGLIHCPWCEMAGKIGMDPFPASLAAAEGAPGRQSNLWSEGAFHLHRILFRPVAESTLQQALGRSQSGSRGRWFIGGLERIDWLRRFFWRSERAAMEGKLKEAEVQLLKVESDADELYARQQLEMGKLAVEAQQAAGALQAPERMRKHFRDQAEFEVREEFLNKHLQGCSIVDLSVQGLGKKRLEVLLDHGLRTIADLTREQLDGLPSIGESMIQRLLHARSDIESEFTLFTSRSVIEGIEARASRDAQRCMNTLRGRIAELQDSAKVIKKQYAQRIQELEGAHHALILRRKTLRNEMR
jgi:DNA-binding helix-hairpin-helix protein with protein kinase domain